MVERLKPYTLYLTENEYSTVLTAAQEYRKAHTPPHQFPCGHSTCGVWGYTYDHNPCPICSAEDTPKQEESHE